MQYDVSTVGYRARLAVFGLNGISPGIQFLIPDLHWTQSHRKMIKVRELEDEQRKCRLPLEGSGDILPLLSIFNSLWGQIGLEFYKNTVKMNNIILYVDVDVKSITYMFLDNL